MLLTRNWAVADKLRDTLVKMQWCGRPPTICPSPYALPCRIWSFCFKGYRRKYRRTLQIGELWNSALGMRVVADPKMHTLPTCVTTSKLVVLHQRVCINRREPQNWRALRPTPCFRGSAHPHEIHPSPTCVILSNLVILWQTVIVVVVVVVHLYSASRSASNALIALLRRSTWKFDPSLTVTVTAFQDHSRSSELTWINLPRITFYRRSITTKVLFCTVSEIVITVENRKFFPPLVYLMPLLKVFCSPVIGYQSSG